MAKAPRDGKEMRAQLTDEDLESVKGGAGMVEDAYEDDCTPPW